MLNLTDREIFLFEQQENFFYDYLIHNVTPYFDEDEMLDTQLHLIAHTFTIIYFSDSLLANMGNPDTCPSFYLPGLLSFIGYEYDTSIDPDIHRIAFKYLFDWQKDRGSELSILKSSSYSANAGWVCGGYFLPGFENNGITSTIFYPSKNIFTWDISNWSGGHKFFDGAYYSKGVIDLYVDVLNDKVIEETKKVLPAGLKIYFKLNRVLAGDNVFGAVLANHYKDDTDLFLHTHLSYTEGEVTSDKFIWGQNQKRRIWAGSHRSLIADINTYIELTDLVYDFKPIDDFEVKRVYGKRVWNSYSSYYSSRNTWSGNRVSDSGIFN